MSAASLSQCNAVKVSMARHDFTGRLLAQPRMQFAKLGSAPNVLLGDAVDRYIVRIEIVARIYEPDISSNFPTILECDNAYLAYAAHPRVRGFEIDCDEAHASP